MSNITTAFNQRNFVSPQADFTTESHKDLINLILKRHGSNFANNIKLIDENDDYDSFLVEVNDMGFCIKISFDQIPIFYDYMILKGIEHLQISPQAIDRGQIEFGKTIYYTIQTFEYSNNISSMGISLLNDESYSHINEILARMHKFAPPTQVWEHLDNTESYLNYHNISFENILQYVDASEQQDYNDIKTLYQNTFNEMMTYFKINESKLKQQKLVHGNLDGSTIISNNFNFKFINWEYAFVGSPFFDLANIVFEMQMSGMKEYDFVTKRISEYGLVENRLKAKEYLEEYKICKYIWTRKRFIDLLCEYIKEVIVLNKTRVDKMARTAHSFSNHFYRFSDIKIFSTNAPILVEKFKSLILD